MSDINTIKTKLDTDNQKGVISEKEFNDNFGKLDQTDYKKISEGLEAKDQQFLTLLQKPIFENIQKKNLLSKQSLSVNEIKTVKLFFMSYGMNANRGGERQKSNEQKMAEMYMNQQGIFYGLGQEGWNEFKKGFKGNIFNFNKSKGKDITYPAGPINMNHPDIKRLNGEQLQITQQIEKVQKDNYNNIQKGMKDIENKEIATRPLSKKLEELKGKNTLDVLDELTSAPNGILYNDNIKEMTYNEQQKIQKIIENVFSNPSINSTQVMDYVWKFHCSLSDEKWSKKTGKKIEGSSLGMVVDNQVGMRTEIINTCYQLAQAKGFGELQSKPETAKRSLVKLCNILTGRFNSTGRGRMMQEDNDKKFNNPELARGILESLMQINGTIDKISPVDILKDEPSLKNKECGNFVAEISQNIPRPLSGEFGILDLVSVDEKTKISQLSPTLQARVIVLKKISEKIKSDQKKVPFESKYIQELKNLGTNEAKTQQAKFESQKEKFKEEIKKAGWYTTSSFGKSAQEYGLQGADTDIFNLYRDFAVNSFWAGQLSDEVDDQIMGYAKMGAMIGGTIVTMMIFPPAGVGYLGSAIAVGVTSTVLTQMFYKKMNYGSFTEGAVDIGSQFVFDTVTAFLGMKVFGPFIQKTPGFFSSVKNITQNVGVTLFDVTVGATAEGVRQMGVNELFDKQEKVDIWQMIRAGGVMATVFLMVSGGFHVKLPVDDMLRHLKANDPKINPNGFKNLKISEVDYQNSIKLLESKSNALRDVDMQTGGNKRESMKEANYTAKKIENSGDITIPKGKLEAPVEKKLSPEVEKLYIETIDKIDDITQQIIDGKIPERDGTENMLLKIIGDPAKTKYHYLKKQLNYEDQVTLKNNLDNFCKRFTERVKTYNEIIDAQKTIKEDIKLFNKLKQDRIDGKHTDDAYFNYAERLLTKMKYAAKPINNILLHDFFEITPSGGIKLFDIDFYCHGSTIIVKYNNHADYESNVNSNSDGSYMRDLGGVTYLKTSDVSIASHELGHGIYNDFGFTKKQVEARTESTDLISSKTMEDKVNKLDLNEYNMVNDFVNKNLEYSIQNAVDEIIQYTTHNKASAFAIKDVLSSDSYNYTKFLDFLIDRYKKHNGNNPPNKQISPELINRNIGHLNNLKDYYNKKIDELCNLAVEAERVGKGNQLIMTPYNEWRKITR